MKSKVLKISTCIIQESANEQYCDTVKDLLLPNTITSLRGKKPHTAGLDDTKIMLEKTQYRNTINPHDPLCGGGGGGGLWSHGGKRDTL